MVVLLPPSVQCIFNVKASEFCCPGALYSSSPCFASATVPTRNSATFGPELQYPRAGRKQHTLPGNGNFHGTELHGDFKAQGELCCYVITLQGASHFRLPLR